MWERRRIVIVFCCCLYLLQAGNDFMRGSNLVPTTKIYESVLPWTVFGPLILPWIFSPGLVQGR